MWGYIYVISLIFSAFALLGIGLYSLRYRTTHGVPFFILLAASSFVWVAGVILSMVSPTPEIAVFWWARVSALGLVYLPALESFFVLSYLGHTRWLAPRRAWLFLIIPTLTAIFVWQPNWQSWLFHTQTTTYGPFILVEMLKPGFWLWVHIVFDYTLTLSNLIMLGIHSVRSQYPYRQQSLLVLIGLSLPNVIEILSQLDVFTGVLHTPPFDFTTLTSTLSCALFSWALIGYRFLDVMPVAREAVFDSMEEGVIVLDTQGRIVDINPAAENVLNVVRQKAVGHPLAKHSREWQNLIAYLAASENTTTELVLEEDEHNRIFDLRISTLYRQKHPIPAGRLIVLQDITARRQAEHALHQYTTELETSNAELDAFAHTVAHDLKTPLTSLLGFSRLIQTRAPRWPLEKVLQNAGYITETGQKMTLIINELLLLASVRRIDEIETIPLDMRGILREVRTRLASMISEYEGTLLLPETWPVAMGYAPWVEEIWVNYVSNALKYGGSPPRIELSADKLTVDGMPYVRFWIKDNGAGLTEAQQAQLFTQFTRLHKVRATGHGLGLSIVQRIATKLGGEVGVESAVGQGSHFYFTLPAAN